jgi:hypothetical protein
MTTSPATPPLEIAVILDAFEQYPSGSILGPIWLRCGEIEFPEAEWSDFPVVILGWWLHEMRPLSLVTTTGQSAELLFMDGPYFFRLTVLHQDQWLVSCFSQRRAHSTLEAEFHCDPTTFLRNLRKTARQVLHRCRLAGYRDNKHDIAFLDNVFNAPFEGATCSPEDI